MRARYRRCGRRPSIRRLLLHVVLTRLNLEIGFARHDPLDPAWLESRLAPFDAICRPSMRRQVADHLWLVAIHARTPAPVVERLRAAPGLTPLALEPPHTVARLGEAVGEAIAGHGASHLLTTRLDSDDALADDHLARLQAAWQAEDAPRFYNFPRGGMWSGGRLYGCVDPANPFLSHAEPLLAGRAPLSAYRVAHVWAHRVAPVRQLWTRRPMWLQLIGAHNEVSVVDGVRSPRRGPPPGFAGQAAFATPDTAARWRELARSAPRYAWAHRRAALRLLRDAAA